MITSKTLDKNSINSQEKNVETVTTMVQSMKSNFPILSNIGTPHDLISEHRLPVRLVMFEFEVRDFETTGKNDQVYTMG